MRRAQTLLRNLVALGSCVTRALLDYPHWKVEGKVTSVARAEWLHVWCVELLERLHIPINVIGVPPASGLIVSNHLGYLDILVFSSVAPAVFVSKSEVKSWPIFGTLATLAGTVYVNRRQRSDTRTANEGIRQALREGLRVVMFPEGTSSDGARVLPFYPSLFEPAIVDGAEVTAAHIAYVAEKGCVAKEIAYWGEMTFFPHLLKLLSKTGVAAQVKFSPTSHRYSDRKNAAREMREQVVSLGERSSA